uniref:T-complex protein 1 subunit eta n=1 Tax=Glossina brevipalpis TaxID=37001 RepID=A0A1A9W6R1_9MUSC
MACEDLFQCSSRTPWFSGKGRFRWNVDSVIGNIGKIVTKNRSPLVEYCERVRDLLLEFERKIDDKLKPFSRACKANDLCATELKKICDDVKSVESARGEKIDELLQYQKKCVVGLDRLRDDAANRRRAEVSEVKSNADVARVPVVAAGAPVVIKPKVKQDSLKTKSDLTTNVDPKAIKFSDVRCRSNSSTVVNCGCEEDRSKAKAAIEGALSDGYVMQVPGKLNPRFKCKEVVRPDGAEVVVCLNCRGYNRYAKHCKENMTCVKCHGKYKSSECSSEPAVKCIDCLRSNVKFKLNLDVNHLTTGCQWYGVDIMKEDISDNFRECVWEPSIIKINALTAAAEAACMILSVDETIKSPKAAEAPAAGGPIGRGVGRPM